MMTRNQRQLLKALEAKRQHTYLASWHVTMAAIILAVNGIEAALEYVKWLPNSRPPTETAFEFHIEEIEQLAMELT